MAEHSWLLPSSQKKINQKAPPHFLSALGEFQLQLNVFEQDTCLHHILEALDPPGLEEDDPSCDPLQDRVDGESVSDVTTLSKRCDDLQPDLAVSQNIPRAAHGSELNAVICSL
jgi:hypothetical protein